MVANAEMSADGKTPRRETESRYSSTVTAGLSSIIHPSHPLLHRSLITRRRVPV